MEMEGKGVSITTETADSIISVAFWRCYRMVEGC